MNALDKKLSDVEAVKSEFYEMEDNTVREAYQHS